MNTIKTPIEAAIDDVGLTQTMLALARTRYSAFEILDALAYVLEQVGTGVPAYDEACAIIVRDAAETIDQIKGEA